MDEARNLDFMVGKTFARVFQKDNDELWFVDSDGNGFCFYHMQDCCECVEIRDICGDLRDLIGAEIFTAEERVHVPTVQEMGLDEYGYYPDSQTWTFYEFVTAAGSVTVNWVGESNGYYSEGVNICRVENNRKVASWEDL